MKTCRLTFLQLPPAMVSPPKRKVWLHSLALRNHQDTGNCTAMEKRRTGVQNEAPRRPGAPNSHLQRHRLGTKVTPVFPNTHRSWNILWDYHIVRTDGGTYFLELERY